VLLTPGGAQGTIDFEVHDYCAAPTPARVILTLASGDPLSLNIVAAPSGASNSCPGVGPAMYSTVLAVPVSVSSTPAPALELRASIALAGRAQPGAHYRYLVTLTNVGNTVAGLQPCPSYNQGLKRRRWRWLRTELLRSQSDPCRW
jgi:hypothetical protein